jgi:hypothetical protein
MKNQAIEWSSHETVMRPGFIPEKAKAYKIPEAMKA